MPSPPPFEPSVALLSSLVASSTSSFTRYLSASTPREKAAALGALAQNAQELSVAATSPFHAIEMLVHQNHAAVCVKIAFKIGVFSALPVAGPATVQEISLAVNAEPDFVLRIIRAIAAVGILVEVEEQSYAHTPMSRIWTYPGAKEAFQYWDDTDVTMSKLASYFDVHGYKSPSDPKNTPVAFAREERDMDLFTLMSRHPPMLDSFNQTMTFSSVMAAKELCELFQFDALKPGENDVVLVDVGGGKGQSLNDILMSFPNMKGQAVLEDLDIVVDSDLIKLGDRVRIQPYNFLADVQPVQGKAANSQPAAK